MHFFCRRGTVYEAETNCQQPIIYQQVNRGARTCCGIVSPRSQPRAGQFVDAINYSPDETFDRTVTGCRCLILVVTCAAPPQRHTGATDEGIASSSAIIAGLQHRPELNGERVTVGRLQPNGRYEVRLRGESVLLRPGTLKRVAGAAAAASASPAPPRLLTMTELGGPPTDGVAPLD